MQIPIILADAHPLLRDGLAARLPELGPIEVMATAADVDVCSQLVRERRPDVVVIDLDLPGGPVLEWISEVTSQGTTRVVALSPRNGRLALERTVQAGAAGYVLKEDPATELSRAIQEVAKGRSTVSRGAGHHLVDAMNRAENSGRANSRGDGAFDLTPREHEVLEGIVSGLSCRELGSRLGISPRTVERHRASLMTKLDIHKTAKLVRFAVREGLIAA